MLFVNIVNILLLKPLVVAHQGLSNKQIIIYVPYQRAITFRILTFFNWKFILKQ